MKTENELRDELKEAENIRQKKPPLLQPTKFFAQAMQMAEQSLNSARKSPESAEVAEWVTPVFLPIILKLARVGASAADSAGKRSTLPTQKEEYIRNALDIAVEPWYQNPVFLRDLQKEVTNKRYEKGDERFLIVEIWRDMAKLLMTAASLYPAAQAEPLIKKSEQMWSSLYHSLEEGHPDKSFIFVERLLFLHEIGQVVHPEDAITGLTDLKTDLEDRNWHRLATMAKKYIFLAEQMGNNGLKEFAQRMFDEQLEKHPEGREMFEENWKKRSFQIGQTIIGAFVPSTEITDSKVALNERLLQLKDPQQVMAESSDQT